MATSTRRARKRRLKAEINVVPYIDVMLVLLIIFMVTAPLLNVGVDVNLPQADAKTLEQKKKKQPVVVQVNKDGSLALLHEGLNQPQAMDKAQLMQKVAAFVQADPELPVYVAGDREASYQTVFEVMGELQGSAKVSRVSLMAKPPADSSKRK